MAKRGKAVICREWNKPVVVEEVEIDSPRRGEVMVKLSACGVCHSDLSATNGTLPLPPPLVLGHEGAGQVVEIGEGVADLAIGDHVLSSFVPQCGRCRFCAIGQPALCDAHGRVYLSLPDGSTRVRDRSGTALHVFSGCGVMADYATVHRDSLVKIDRDLPLDRAALVSCGVMTGVGAAINTAQVEPGSSAVVFGAGGVGLNVIQGCALAGATKIIAVDLVDKKLEFAREFGATHAVNPRTEGDAVARGIELTGGGADYGFECIGLGATITDTFKAVRKGGMAVVVGVARPTEQASIPAVFITMTEKTIKGSWFGSGRVNVDFPRLLARYKAGRLKLDELVTNTYPIEDAPRAFEDLEKGINARGVIVF
jgi:S-(hydroxymethyl)glutathione dehydrogenase/alcohol dehydrogenase